MPKDILLYNRVDAESSAEFINELSEAEGYDIVVRVNGPGGSPEYGWGMVAKFSEFQGKKKIKVDGMAFSMYCSLLCYCDDVEALDVSEFMVHRAAYPEWFESNPEYFTEPYKQNLIRINASLEKAFRAKVNVEAFENMKQCKDAGITVESLFSMDQRCDVFFSAKDAKKIGLINKINAITPSIAAEIERHQIIVVAKAAHFVSKPIKNDKVMTLAELKAAHPEVYAQAVNEGVIEERDRVGSILAFIDIDAKECETIVASGKKLTETQRSEFAKKQVSKMALGLLKTESADAIPTVENPVSTGAKTDAQKHAEKLAALEADLMSGLE